MNRAGIKVTEGITLLYLDFTNLSLPQEFELVIAEAEAIRHSFKESKSSKILLIADFSNSVFTPDVYDIIIKYSRLITTITKKHAVVGLKPTSLIRTILRTYTGIDVPAFKSIKEAEEWLLKPERNRAKT